MDTSTEANALWRDSLILSDSEQPTTKQDIQPKDEDYTTLDPQTYDVIEVDALFKSIDYTQTEIGHLQLFRSLAHPTTNVDHLKQKQEALRELESKPEMQQALKAFVKHCSKDEATLYHLLYGEFAGGLATEEPPRTGKMAFGGYGYSQFKYGTLFTAEMVQGAANLPKAESPYLRGIFDAISEFGQTRIFSLMKGPVYLASGKFRTRDEKKQSWPAFRFQPSMFKIAPMLFTIFFVSCLLFLTPLMLPELAVSDIAIGIVALMIPILPIIILAIGASDRDSVIYPLRRQFRESPELAKALEALGMLDELLTFRQYAETNQRTTTLPEIVNDEKHLLSVQQARNPLLDTTNPDFVPNDITLDPSSRLLIITGPNSGGKTAYCKTVAQTQVLGQAGCYIPANSARLAPAEHIYYQVPDPGRLDAGMGRFGHELNRTREIFFNSTPRSLVMLDELSEGTTFEEKMTLSEYILKGFHKLGASTLLVTHNHELCEQLQSEQIGHYLQVEFLMDGPTHRLIPGVSKVSHADRVASKIGFSQEDIEQHLANRNQQTEFSS